MKVLKSWIHANRLKLYHDSRDQFYTRNKQQNTFSTASNQQAMHGSTVQKSLNEPLSDGKRNVQRTNSQIVNTPTQTLPTPTSSDSTEWYEIDDILKHRRVRGTLHYYVRWKIDSSCSWIPVHGVSPGA